MKLKALIVDDEYPAREELRLHLSQYDTIEIVGEAATVEEAITLISGISYDLVFLDINFPVSNGIDLGKRILALSNDIQIIYVTAFEKYALDAFGVNAVDYILKPIDPSDFDRAIQKVLKYQDLKSLNQISGTIENKPEHLEVSNTVQEISKITAELDGKIILVDEADIVYAYAEKGYVFLKLSKQTLITKYTLNTLEEKLKSPSFFRASRSHLVNLNKISEIAPFFKSSIHLVMKDSEKSKVVVSRRQTKILRSLLDF